MPDWTRATCQSCDGHRSVVGPISWGGLCAACGEVRVLANRRQLKSHSGDFFQHHRRACVAAFGGVLLDDVRDSGQA